MLDLFVFVFIGLGLFIGGQFYGEWRMKKKASFQMTAMHAGMTAYHDALGEILKENHNLDIKELDKLATRRSLEAQLKTIKDVLTKAVEGMENGKDKSGKQGDGEGS